MNKKQAKKRNPGLVRAPMVVALLTVALFGYPLLNSIADTAKPAAHGAVNWPPKLNSRYPDLELMSTSGRRVRLSSFAGKTILLEPIGMSCPACQAFVGASQKGGFQGCNPQAGLPSIESMLKQNGISPTDSRLERVQLILYSPSMDAPSLEQAKDWAQHFGFGNGSNELILLGDKSYINSGSYNMIPGFQLIDRDFILRCDATGHNPANDLYKELLPMLKRSLQ